MNIFNIWYTLDDKTSLELSWKPGLAATGKLPINNTDRVQDWRETAAGFAFLELCLCVRGFRLPLVWWDDRHCDGGAVRAAGD